MPDIDHSANYWTRSGRGVSRRTVLRGALVAGTGLSAAALLGCGSDDESAPTTAQPAPAAPTATTAPTNGVAAPAPGTIPDGALIPRVAGAPTYGGTFNDGVAFTNAVHDMHTAGAGTVWHVLGGRGMRLGAFSGELEAEMVEEWEIVDDQGLELLMHVRPGMALHDKEPWNGRDFNAEDLAFNLERNVGVYAEAEGLPLTSFQRRSMVAGLSAAEAVDDRTVRLSMSQPNGAIFNGMIDSRMVLMPKGVVEVGFDDPTKFAGVGPFTMSEFRPGERETYVKHPNFYRGEPYFDEIRKTVIGDRASQVAAFIDRQTDLLSGVVERERDAVLQANRDAQFFEYPGVSWYHIRWNHLNEALADPRVRQAFWLATDRGEIMSGFFGAGWGLAGVAVTAFPESWDAAKLETLPGYNPATRDADRAEAARLLEAAGYPDGAGIDFSLMPYPSAAMEENGLRFQDQMLGLFPEMDLQLQRPSDAAAFATLQAAREFDVISYVIGPSAPDIFLEWHGQYHTDGSRNYGSFSNPEADELVERGLRALVQEERMEIAEEYQQRFTTEWFANVILGGAHTRFMVQGDIGGFDQVAGPWWVGTGYGLTDAGGFYRV